LIYALRTGLWESKGGEFGTTKQNGCWLVSNVVRIGLRQSLKESSVHEPLSALLLLVCVLSFSVHHTCFVPFATVLFTTEERRETLLAAQARKQAIRAVFQLG
jgi:hypothetical protein